jgi:DNA-binding response OmpR family regulator
MSQEKILVVDDDKIIVRQLRRLFEHEDFHVLVAYGGAGAIKIATEEHPDLILLDIQMPDVNGFDVLAKIKERNIPTRVIMITGYRESIEDVVQFIKAGACDYFIKPLDVRMLTNRVKHALAIETTMNLHVTDTTPIVEELMAKAQKLSEDNRKLQKQLKRHRYVTFVIRFLCLVVAVGVAMLFYSLNVITSSWALILTVVVVHLLLVLPIEKATKLIIKAPKSETHLEMDK